MGNFYPLWKYLILLFTIGVSAYPSTLGRNYHLLEYNSIHQKLKNNGRISSSNEIDYRPFSKLKIPTDFLDFLNLSENNRKIKNEQLQLKQQNQLQKQIPYKENKEWQLSSSPSIASILNRSQKMFDYDNNDIEYGRSLNEILSNDLSHRLKKNHRILNPSSETTKKDINYDNDDGKHEEIDSSSGIDDNDVEGSASLINKDNEENNSDSDENILDKNFNAKAKQLKCLNSKVYEQANNDQISFNKEHLICQNADEQKRNAFRNNKRQKLQAAHQTQFIPSISVGAMNNLGDFFNSLKNNVDVLEKGELSENVEQLLEGDHIISTLRKQLLPSSSSSDDNNGNGNVKPAGTAAFLHAIRTYRPSSRIRALVSMQPDGYHGSNFLDPNYMWLGLG